MLPPPWYGPPDPGPRHNVPPLGHARLLTFHICLFFPHLVKFLANTVQFNTICKDYDSINQHSHQSTRTTGPQGGRGANHDHAGATLEHIYIYIYIYICIICHLCLMIHLKGSDPQAGSNCCCRPHTALKKSSKASPSRRPPTHPTPGRRSIRRRQSVLATPF